MAKAGKGMGNESVSGHQTAGATDFTEQDELPDLQGKNSLRGNDQSKVHNQRHTMPGETDRTEGVVESFERMDPRVRAEQDRRERENG